MPHRRFTNEQIAFALGQAESGATVDEVCRTVGVSEPTVFRWTVRPSAWARRRSAGSGGWWPT